MIAIMRVLMRRAACATLQHMRRSSLDALHVATALRTGADVLVSYDGPMAEAAQAVGMPTLAPQGSKDSRC